MLVRPITTEPARRSRATTGASFSAGAESSNAREPARVTCPLMSKRSLIETGMPAKRVGAACALRKWSIASAASSAASLSTWMKVRCPSPTGSAIRPMHSSTSLRAVVRPAARSSASAARVGFGMLLLPDYSWWLLVLGQDDFEVEQRGAQRLTVRVERQRTRHAAPERLVHHKIQRRDVRQLITHHAAFDNAGEMRFHAIGGHLFLQ